MKSRIISLLTVAALFAGTSIAQKPTTTSDPQSKQAQAKQTFKELQDLMVRLATTLAKTEPDNARTLQLGTRLSQEKQIEADMNKALELMRERNWDGALELMRDVRSNLSKLLNFSGHFGNPAVLDHVPYRHLLEKRQCRLKPFRFVFSSDSFPITPI